MAAACGEKDDPIRQRAENGGTGSEARRTAIAAHSGRKGAIREREPLPAFPLRLALCRLPAAYFPAGFANSESATPVFTVHLSTVRMNVVPMTVCSFFVGIDTPPNGL